MKKILLLCFSVWLSLASWAADFEENGLYYNIVDGGVEVTWGGSSHTAGTASYTGEMTIPSDVTHGEATYTVVGIGEYAFYTCALTSISIPETAEYIGKFAFYECKQLTDAAIGDGVTEIMSNAFYECGIKNITLGNSLTSIDYGAFFQCEELESIKFPDSLLSIDSQVFQNCTNLKYVTFGNSLESIGSMAFSGADILELELPNSLVSITNGFEFYKNTNLKKVTLGNAVESLGSFTFFNCTGLEEFYSPIETPPSGAAYAFTGASTSTCVLYVPEGCVDAYKVASGWKDFYDIEEILPEGINSIDSDVDKPNVEGYFSINGVKLNAPQKGVNIVRYEDGSAKKMIMK